MNKMLEKLKNNYGLAKTNYNSYIEQITAINPTKEEILKLKELEEEMYRYYNMYIRSGGFQHALRNGDIIRVDNHQRKDDIYDEFLSSKEHVQEENFFGVGFEYLKRGPLWIKLSLG